VLVGLRTQPTQHRVRTKAPQLPRSGDKQDMLLQMYRVLLLPKTQPTQDQLSTKALKLYGVGGHNLLQVYKVFSRRRTDSRPIPDRPRTEAPMLRGGVAESVLRRTL
jgi:hypothetical protein